MQVATAVAAHLHLADPLFLQFTSHMSFHDLPGNKIRRTSIDGDVTLSSMLRDYQRRASHVLYYEPV